MVPTFFLFRTTPKEVTTQEILIFGIIIGVILLYGVFTFIYDRYRKMIYTIKQNKDDVNDIKKDLNLNKYFNKMEVRIKVLEEMIKRGKKGQIDLRVILIIILIVLLILFLRVSEII